MPMASDLAVILTAKRHDTDRHGTGAPREAHALRRAAHSAEAAWRRHAKVALPPRLCAKAIEDRLALRRGWSRGLQAA